MGKLSRIEERLSEDGDYNLVTEARCGSSKAKIFFVSIISFVVALIIVLLVVVIKVDSRFGSAAETPDKPGCIDVAIIGAGLAGSYTAWRLREKNLHITLYEMSSKAGGRIHTTSMPQLPEVFFEFGAPHFNPDQQPHLLALVETLGLKLRPSSYWEHENSTGYHLRGLNIDMKQLGTSNIPYNLRPDEAGRDPQELIRYFMEQIVSVRNRSHVLNMITEDDKLLMEQSYITLLRNRASPEAFRFLHDTLDRHLMDIHGNAAILGHLVDQTVNQQTLPYNNDSTTINSTTAISPTTEVYGYTTANITSTTDSSEYSNLEGYFTVFEGMDYLPRTLIAQFVGAGVDHRYLTNHLLWKVQREDGSYQLHFNQTSYEYGTIKSIENVKPICAKKVIFAIPPEAIEKVETVGIPNLAVEDMYAQHRVTSLDMTLIFNQSLFDNISIWQHTKTDLPVTRVTNIQSYQSETGTHQIQNYTLLHVKSNAKDADYLLDAANEENIYSKDQTVQLCCANQTERKLLDLVLKYVNDIYNMTDIPPPQEVLFHQWDPLTVGSAWHVWKPHVNWSKLTENIGRPSKQHDIFIVGSAYSPPDKQNIMDGAILSVDNVIDEHFMHEFG